MRRYNQVFHWIGHNVASEYEKCRGSSKKLYKIIQRLNPDYAKLAEFTQAIMSVDPQMPELRIWDHYKLMKAWGKVSECLQWAGAPKDTYESEEWINKTILNIEDASIYIWENSISGFAGIMMSSNMAHEIHIIWLKYKDNEINRDAVSDEPESMVQRIKGVGHFLSWPRADFFTWPINRIVVVKPTKFCDTRKPQPVLCFFWIIFFLTPSRS